MKRLMICAPPVPRTDLKISIFEISDANSQELRCSMQDLGVTESRNRNARFPTV